MKQRLSCNTSMFEMKYLFSVLLSGEGFLSKHLERCVWLVFHRRDKWTCQTRFFPLGSSLTHWKKGHNRLQHLKNNLPGFFLNGTWSWPRGWRSDISSCPGVDSGSTRGVDVWLSLSNLLHCPNCNSQNNLWRNTWSIPNDPTGCWFLFCLKLGQDGQDREKGWV